jgi:hypothetical protein
MSRGKRGAAQRTLSRLSGSPRMECPICEDSGHRSDSHEITPRHTSCRRHPRVQKDTFLSSTRRTLPRLRRHAALIQCGGRNQPTSSGRKTCTSARGTWWMCLFPKSKMQTSLKKSHLLIIIRTTGDNVHSSGDERTSWSWSCHAYERARSEIEILPLVSMCAHECGETCLNPSLQPIII